MTNLTPADEAFQNACVAFLKAAKEEHGRPEQAFYDGVSALGSLYAAAAVDQPRKLIDVIFEGMAHAAISAIADMKRGVLSE